MSFAFRPADFANVHPVPAAGGVLGGPPAPPSAPSFPRPLVLGLTGPGGCGKSTVARALVKLLSADALSRAADGCRSAVREIASGSAEIVHTAAPLKAALRAIYEAAGLTPAQITRRIDGDGKRSPCAILGGRTPTHAMQTLGTEWGRDLIHPDLLVDLWRVRAEAVLETGRVVLNDSVRFENEAAAIRALGGVVVQLTGRAGDLAASHASEAGVSPDLIVENCGTPEETAQDVLDAVLVHLLGRRPPEPMNPAFWAPLRGLWGRVCPALPH